MSKIRIYELAKELGVENKAVISKAVELGLAGKTSHSSSLEADEADQIRRSVIRAAVGKDAAPRNSEVVTTRVDRMTGETQAVLEKRSGNVIRRRRTADVPAAAEDTRALEAEHSAEVLSPSSDFVEPAAEVAEASPVEIIPETVEPSPSLETASALEEASTPSPEAKPAIRAGPRVLGRLVKPAPVPPPPAARAEEPSPVEAPPAVAAAPSPLPEAPKKPVPGPRVLGKIDLPAPRPKPTPGAKQETGRAFTVKAVSDRAPEEEEDSDGRKAAARKKGRKREIDRLDLLDYEGREPRRATGAKTGGKRKQAVDQEKQPSADAKPKPQKKIVRIDEMITVGELAKQMSLKAAEVIAKLMQLGMMATINQAIDVDTATIVAEEFGAEVERTNFVEANLLEDQTPEDASQVAPRAPVVTVMGHVDHGKTSLLDAIRETSVASREHGGITQHIGAYQVKVAKRGYITFIDTPGHAAFTSMRARGARVTDIVVLVVAADDGVMPQTLEAISHAKAAGVPIVVAVNKMDKPDANPDRIRQQLSEQGLSPEDWGGDTMYFRVSALKKQGLSELLEGILLQAEVKELRANPHRRARGTIIEAKQDKGRGTVATVLVQNGTLRVGDIFVAGAEYGRVRSMLSDVGDKQDEAGPSKPVEITGFTGVPQAGDDFFVVESEVDAREVSEQRRQKKALKEQRVATGPMSLEEFARRANSIDLAELNVIVKADVHGSLEALREAIEKLSTDKVKVHVIHSGVGGITESDVQLALASRAIVIGFGVRAEARAQAEAESLGVDLRFYRIIYELLDDVKKAMAGLLAPIRQEVRTGRVEVRETFTVPKIGTVAGCYVLDGVIKRTSFARLLRDSKVVHEGKLASLRRFKDDVREVQNGYECGVMMEAYNDVKPGDQIEVFDIKEVAATLE